MPKSSSKGLPFFEDSDYTKRGTHVIIPSVIFSEQDWTEATDTDAPADEWDEAEYNRQMRLHLTKVYGSKTLLYLRELLRNRGLKIRGNKDVVAARLAQDHVRRMYGEDPSPEATGQQEQKSTGQ